MRGRMALLLGMAMLPAGAIAMHLGLSALEARQSAFEDSLTRRAEQALQVERSVIHEVRELVRVMATSPPLQNLEARACRAWLQDLTAQYSYVATLSVSTESGEIVCSIPEAPEGFRASNSGLREIARDRDAFTMSYVEFGRLAQQPVLGALEPMRNANGARIGFIGASISVRQLEELLDRAQRKDGARIALLDATGNPFVQSQPRRGEPYPELPSAREMRRAFGAQPVLLEADDGSPAVLMPLEAPDVYAVMAWPAQGGMVSRFFQLAVPIAAPLLIWLLAVAAGWFAIEVYVARPLSSLEQSARKFARGEEVEDGLTGPSAPVEIRSLRRTLAAMAKTLRGREARLVEALGEERALLREVHHRVKNNLQMVASLLNIQARSARDDSEAWGLARAHDRVQLLALVHQRIYASGEVREIRLDEITAEIARQLIQGRGAAVKELTLNLDLKEARCSADRAVPMAFLIGEALSAAMDSVSDTGAATLDVALVQEPEGALRIAVTTIGALDVRASPSGRLIDAFARQLGAHIGRVDAPFALWATVPPAKEEA